MARYFPSIDKRDMDEPEMMGYLGQVQAMEKRQADTLAYSIAGLLGKMFAK